LRKKYAYFFPKHTIMNLRFLTFLVLSVSFTFNQKIHAQERSAEDTDAFYIKEIYTKALTEGKCYDWLTDLTTNIGGRLAGTPQAAAAVEWTKQMLDTLGLDNVYLQPCMVPHWNRGDKEIVRIATSVSGSMDLRATALGNSLGTGDLGVTAEVIEVKSLKEVEALGDKIRGKIVFYNRPMDNSNFRTFTAYGGAGDQRWGGPSKAAEYGAVAVLTRSLTTRLDDYPHTGSMGYNEKFPKIAACAISTNDSEKLSRLLKAGKVTVYMRTTSEMLSDKPSANVIGEIRGSEFPDEIILIGGHLDSWDIGRGAHDDGAGCVHAMDVLQLMKRLNYKPKRTIRCVLFMNEENGLAGAKEYWKQSNAKGEFHTAALESDSGGFTPRGFQTEGHPDVYVDKHRQLTQWLPLLEPYGLGFTTGGSGADISGLKDQKGLLIGFRPDSQRYFDYHHTEIDNIDAVNKRELELGAASILSIVYLIDKYGLK
jgi:carboxypeptidase Q